MARKSTGRHCPTCKESLVRIDRSGKLNPQGGWEVCPVALMEHDPASFLEPWRRRAHAKLDVTPHPTTARRQRREREAVEPLLFDDPNAGRRPPRKPSAHPTTGNRE